MDSGLQGLTVWLTGASGGIGVEIVKAFAQEGCNLVLQAGRNREGVEDVVHRLGLAGRAVVDAFEVTDRAATDALLLAAAARFGRVDVAVPCAGIWPAEHRLLHELDVARMEEVVRVNLVGAMVGAGAFMRHLAATGPRPDGVGASICFVGSTAGRFGEAGHSPYAATKAGLRGLVRTLKNEIVALDPYGRVNMVEPGWTVTPMAEATLDEPGVVERVLATMPLQQLARPCDVARAVAMLSAPLLSRHISGEILTVAGGMEGRALWPAQAVNPDRVRARLRPDE